MRVSIAARRCEVSDTARTRAEEQLEKLTKFEPRLSAAEVTFEVGFNSRAYFTRCFKEKFHQLPSVYMAAAGG